MARARIPKLYKLNRDASIDFLSVFNAELTNKSMESHLVLVLGCRSKSNTRNLGINVGEIIRSPLNYTM